MFSNPIHNIAQFDLQSGSTVADLGAGSGEVSFAAARAVGGAGKVYAVDVQKGLLDRLKKHADEERLSWIKPVWGDAERIGGTHLGDSSVDAVIVSNLLFQIEDRAGLTKEIARILRPKGKVLLIDWSDSFGGMGPQPAEVVAKPAAKELFEKNGFSFVKSIEAGAHHYGFIFKKN